MKRPHVLENRGLTGERGVAITLVLLVGVVLMMISAVVVLRSLRSAGNAGSNADWEQALGVADAGMDVAMAIRDIDFRHTTGNALPASFADLEEERAWVLAEVASEPTVATPDGEYAVVVPRDSEVIYAVGYVPSRDHPSVRTRVVRMEYRSFNFVFEMALLSGGDVDFGGGALTVDPTGGTGAHVHGNGTLTLGNNVLIDGCGTSSVSEFPATEDCPESPIDPFPIPRINPRPYYSFAEVALCPDGTARGGPAHSTNPDPTPLTPCDPGDLLVDSPGWRPTVRIGYADWAATDASGIFYVYRGNVLAKIGKDHPVFPEPIEVAIFAEGTPGWEDCTGPAGHVTVSAGAFMVTPESMLEGRTTIIASGDIKYLGGAIVQGAIFAYEQVAYGGGPESWGPVLAADSCDSPFSPVSDESTVIGGGVISFSGELPTLLEVGIVPELWEEL